MPKWLVVNAFDDKRKEFLTAFNVEHIATATMIGKDTVLGTVEGKAYLVDLSFNDFKRMAANDFEPE